jgi:plasmid stabilization system protein ParE
MKYKIVISNAAKADIINAIKWYKEHVPTKVKALSIAIDKTAKSLNKFPERFQTKYKQHRAAPIHAFEYSFHYFIDKQNFTVLVTALFHDKENPKKWIK